MNKIIRIGIDTSKSVFVLHGVDAAEQPVLRRKLRRGQLLEFFAKLEPTMPPELTAEHDKVAARFGS